MDIDPIFANAPSTLTPADLYHCPNKEEASGDIFRAIESADIRAVRAMLDDPHVDLNVENDGAQNPLHYAISIGNNEAALALIEKCGGDHNFVNACDRYGYTPLMRASENNNIALMVALIRVRAAIISGHDANCSPSMLTAKRTAISKAFILQDAKGNVFAALLIAATRGNISAAKSFIASGADSSAALCSVSICGSLHEAATLVAAGADPSHALMTSASGTLDSAKNRAKAVQMLLSVGADLSTALAYAVAANQIVAVRILLFLGADGAHALVSAVQDRDAKGTALLIDAGADASTALERFAALNDAESLKFMVAERADVCTALKTLAANDRVDAVKALLAVAEKSAAVVLTSVVEGRNKAAVTALINAGAQTYDVMSAFAQRCDIAALRLLIASGADPSNLLLRNLKAGKLLNAAILLASGADASLALQRAQSNESVALAETLAPVRSEVSLVLNELGVPDNTAVVAKLLAVREPRFSLQRASHQSAGVALRDLQALVRNTTVGATALGFALYSGDWKNIKSLSQEFPEAARMTLALALEERDATAAQLLIAAGVGYSALFRAAAERGDVATLAFLINAGVDRPRALKLLIAEELAHLAKALIQNEGVDYLDVLKELTESGMPGALKWFIPDMVDGSDALIRAIKNNDDALISALLSAGADSAKALVNVIGKADIKAARALVKYGVDMSAALAYAMAANQKGAAQVLIMMGAEVSVALMYALKSGQAKAADALVDTGADYVDALVQATGRGDLRVAVLCMQKGANQAAALRIAAVNSQPSAARVLVVGGADIRLALSGTAAHDGLTAVTTMLAAGVDMPLLLLHAAVSGWPDAVRALITRGADLSVALAYAIDDGSQAAIRALLLLGADGTTALISAIDNGKYKEAQSLLQAGLDPLVVVKQAVERGLLNVVQWLVNETADVSAVMRKLAQSGDIRAIKLWSDAGGDTYMVELLLELAKAGNVPAIKSLIDAGQNSVIALTDTVIKKDLRTAAMLIAAGADISGVLRSTPKRRLDERKAFIEAAKREMTVLSLGMATAPTARDANSLLLIRPSDRGTRGGSHDATVMVTRGARLVDAYEAVMRTAQPGDQYWREMLSAAGVDAAAALGIAISKGHIVAVRELVSLGIDPTVAMKDAVTGEYMAHPAVFRLFGADLSAVLMHAAAISNQYAVEQLIGMGVDAAAAIRHADERGDWKALNLLTSASAAQKSRH